MKKTLAIIAIVAIGLALTAQAQDIDINLGRITITAETLPDVRTWLDAQAPLYSNSVAVVDGVTNIVQVVIPENPQAKATRCMRAIARAAINKAVRDVKRANAVHEANAAPVFTNVEVE